MQANKLPVRQSRQYHKSQMLLNLVNKDLYSFYTAFSSHGEVSTNQW